jgi:hypothetical protein
MITGIERILAVAFSSVVAYGISYFAYRKTTAAFWSYFSVWIAEVPILLLFLTGAKNTAWFDLFTHTLGIPVFACILAIADIILMEAALVGLLKPISFILPKTAKEIIGIENAVKTLQKYHAMPRPEKVGMVIGAALIGSAVSLAVLLAAGAFS